MELLTRNPVLGIGPGSWRPATGSKLESHNLYGQLAGEMGLLGVVTFGAILFCFAMNLRAMKHDPAGSNSFEHRLGSAVAMSVFLLLFMGNFGHNLFRHNWLWFGGFLIVARYVVERRKASVPFAHGMIQSRVLSWRVRMPAAG
jgi:O-antigen ligase